MKRSDIVKELINMGFNAETTETIKNGVECRGIVFKDGGRIAPVIYTDEIIKAAEETGRSAEDVVRGLVKIYEEHKAPDIDMDKIMTVDFFKNHAMIGLQREGHEDIIRRSSDFAGIEEYIYLQITPEASAKVKDTMLGIVGISEAEAWQLAMVNTCKTSKIKNMAEVLTAMGVPSEACPIWIVTNTSGIKGAAGILNKKMLSNFAKDMHTKKLYMIPSSIHEVLIMPYSEDFAPNELTAMILEVNAAEVDPVEQLGDKPYIIDVA